MSEHKYYQEEGALPVNHKYKPMTAAEVMADAWIPEGEKLPEPFDTVLISILCKNGFGEPARLETIGFLKYGKWHSYTGPILGEERVTHWMPMPASPREA